MKINFNNPYVKWGITSVCVICFSLLFYFLLFHSYKLMIGLKSLINISMPIIWGLIMSYLFTPLLNYIEVIQIKICEKFKIVKNKKRTKVIRGIGIIVTWCIIIAIIYILISMLVKQIIPSIQIIIGDFNVYIDNATKWLTKLSTENEQFSVIGADLITRYSTSITNWFNNVLLPQSSEVLKFLSMGLLNILFVIWDVLIGFIISIYIMFNKEAFLGQAKKIAYALLEINSANKLINFVRFTHKTFSGFIVGKIIDSIIIGLLCFIGTTLLDMPFPPLISVIIGVTNVVPFFGPWFGGIPCAILVLLVDITNPLKFVYFILFVLFLQQLDGNIIGPKILGDSTGLPSFWVIVSIILFGGFFGVPGMIVGVPTTAVLFAAITGVLNDRLRKKELEHHYTEFIEVDIVNSDGKLIYNKQNDETDMTTKSFKNLLFGKRDKKKKRK